MRNIGLIANFNVKEKAQTALLVADKLEAFDCKILIPSQYKEKIFRGMMHRSNFEYLSYDEIYERAELAIVLGGDGFILDASRRAAPLGVPILGINLGRVGYMAELEVDELDLIEKYFTGEYRIDERAMLEVRVISSGELQKFSSYALNDVVIANGSTARIVDLQLLDNGEPISTYRADGLIVATPTGSTAYSLSAGGPIVDPKLSCFCVTPICPHSLGARPIVFPDSAKLEIKNICVREKLLHLTLDGKATFDMFYGDVAEISRAKLSTKLVRIKSGGFYSKIRAKKFM
ncbi:MAG: NAD(+)/NADH kinase [Clostridia bacterium]|nr:NAD(+)/NADH kinase [Clostridia bacterium]